jgi:hypothetical protein
MTAIFAASAASVAVMAGALELCKIVGVSWLYRNWKSTSVAIKSYLSGAIIVLILINSLGVFGYLSKAHIEQGVHISSTVGVESEILNFKIDEKKRALETATKNIQNFDSQAEKLSSQSLDKNGKLKSKELAEVRNQQQKATAERDLIATDLTTLLSKKARVDANEAKLEAEVGPLKYIAEAVYGSSGAEAVDKAVRWVIMVIVMVFDPLAICLLIAANDGFIREKQLMNVREDGIVEVSHDDIREM